MLILLAHLPLLCLVVVVILVFAFLVLLVLVAIPGLEEGLKVHFG